MRISIKEEPPISRDLKTETIPIAAIDGALSAVAGETERTRAMLAGTLRVSLLAPRHDSIDANSFFVG